MAALIFIQAKASHGFTDYVGHFGINSIERTFDMSLELIGYFSVYWPNAYSKGARFVFFLILSALAAFGLAYAIYKAKWLSAEPIGRTFRSLYRVFYRKYWFDELYEQVFVVRVLLNGLFRVFQVFDTYIVDGLVNGVAGGTVTAGRMIRNAETGRLQTYALVMFGGILIIIGLVYWLT